MSFQNLSESDVLKKVMSSELVNNEVINLIQNRLIADGTYSTGEPIVTYKAYEQAIGNSYAINTIRGTSVYKGKLQKSGFAGIHDHVTLYDTGAFYKSMATEAMATELIVTADSVKDDGLIEDNVDTDGVLELTTEQLGRLSEYITEAVITEIKDAWKAQ